MNKEEDIKGFCKILGITKEQYKLYCDDKAITELRQELLRKTSFDNTKTKSDTNSNKTLDKELDREQYRMMMRKGK